MLLTLTKVCEFKTVTSHDNTKYNKFIEFT